MNLEEENTEIMIIKATTYGRPASCQLLSLPFLNLQLFKRVIVLFTEEETKTQ